MRRKLILALGISMVAGLATLPAFAAAPNTVRASVSSANAQADASSSLPGPSANRAVSGDGRYVVFSSSATNLVGGDTNAVGDVFIRDRVSGKTRRVSVSSSGAEANASSFNASVSADGRFVAFASSASNLIASDSNGVNDVFVRDRSTGKTKRVSVSSGGAQGDASSGASVSISANGRFVVFTSDATNLVPGDTNATSDIFIRDLAAGKTRRVSISSSGAQADGSSDRTSVSGDGNVVAFDSIATNLVAGDTNGTRDVFVRIRSTGKTRRVSVSSGGAEANNSSDFSAISANGKVVTYTSVATNLIATDSNGVRDIFVRVLSKNKTGRVSVSSAEAQADASSDQPCISAGGRFVGFQSGATNLVGSDANATNDIFVRDRKAGKTRRVSVRFDGTEANGGSFSCEISGDGRFVAFVSGATNLVGGDSNGFNDIFIRGPLM
jgi:tricorn protease-like protein